MENFKSLFRRAEKIVLAASMWGALNISEVNAQNPLSAVETKIGEPHLELHSDQNMPEGFVREEVVGNFEGRKEVVGSIFLFQDIKTKAYFLSDKQHPGVFTPAIDYQKINKVVEGSGGEVVIAFAGAYKSPSGAIEGMAIENGKKVGEQDYSKCSKIGRGKV